MGRRRKSVQVSSEEEEGHEKWKSNHLGPGTGQVGAPAAPGQPLPSPRRNLTRRSPPPAPRLLGPSQRPGSTGSLAPFSAPAATSPTDPSVALELAAPPWSPNPRFPTACPGPPFPSHPGRAQRAGRPRLRLPKRSRAPLELPRARHQGSRRRRPWASEGPGFDTAAAPAPSDPARYP